MAKKKAQLTVSKKGWGILFKGAPYWSIWRTKRRAADAASPGETVCAATLTLTIPAKNERQK